MELPLKITTIFLKFQLGYRLKELLYKSISLHCYKYRLIKSGSGGFLAATMLEQDLNSEIKHLQEQELKENDCTKKNAGTSIEINSILVPA